MALALELLRDDVLDCLISSETTYESLPEVMPALAGNRADGMASDTLCHRILYPDT